jgi:hypothetical protein
MTTKFTVGQRKFLEWIQDNKMGNLVQGQCVQVRNGLEDGEYVTDGKRSIGYNKIRLRYLDEYTKTL